MRGAKDETCLAASLACFRTCCLSKDESWVRLTVWRFANVRSHPGTIEPRVGKVFAASERTTTLSQSNLLGDCWGSKSQSKRTVSITKTHLFAGCSSMCGIYR